MINLNKELEAMQKARIDYSIAHNAKLAAEERAFDNWINQENRGGVSFRLSLPGYPDNYVYSAAQIFKYIDPITYQARLEKFTASAVTVDIIK